MSVRVVAREDGKVSCKTADGSVINVTISTRSFWDALADHIKSEASSTSISKAISKATAIPVILGVSQFPLGVICIAIHIFTMVTQIEMSIVSYTGALLWMGIPFIVSSLSEVVAYTKNLFFWVFLSFISQLLIFSISVAGLVIAEAARYNMDYWPEDPCERLLNSFQSGSNQYYNSQNSYNQNSGYYPGGSNEYLKNCQEAFKQSKVLKTGFMIILFIIGSWGVISSIIAVIYKLKGICKPCSSYKKLADTEPEKALPHTMTV